MTETAIPEDIREKATRFAGEYLAHDVSCERLYRDVAALLMAERERAARIVEDHMLCGPNDGELLLPRTNPGNKLGFAYAAAIRNHP